MGGCNQCMTDKRETGAVVIDKRLDLDRLEALPEDSLMKTHS